VRVVPSVHSTAGRPAVTFYKPLQRFGSHTLLLVRIRTGVRHQIRVHLASIGHAVVGDRIYDEGAALPGSERHLLHARQIELRHPFSSEMLQIRSELPEDFAGVLARLRAPR
jgi:23S rRNA pseudouridine1911/1915/1917 synthase